MKRKIKDTVFRIYASSGIGVSENCLMTASRGYIGIKTGHFYSPDDYYHSPLIKARIKEIDDQNKTGMYHLYKEFSDLNEENNISQKEKYINAIVTLREAHWMGKHRIYYCIELEEFFSDDEIEILQK